jgi:hypothetical protein
MPCLAVLLDSVQAFSRYPVNAGLWAIRATANAFGWAGGVDAMGVGAQVTTYTAGEPVAVATLADADVLIWDRQNQIDGTASEAMTSGADLVDLGGLPFGTGGRIAPRWQRSIRLRSGSREDWRWFKAFISRMRARQGAFLLSTNRPDLVYVATVATGATGGIAVSGASVVGAGDYASWYVSGAHRRLAITLSDGTIVYATVTALPVDNGDGTLTLSLDAGVVGTVTKVSLLEQVRFDRDEIAATWNGGVFAIDEPAVTVQDVLDPPSLFLFDTVLPLTTYINVGSTYVELTLALGQSTVINPRFVSGGGSDNSGHIGAITAIGGNVDGMVVFVPCHVTPANNQAIFFDHESLLLTDTSRIRNSGAAVSSTLLGGAMFRYNGSLQRWIQISLT